MKNIIIAILAASTLFTALSAQKSSAGYQIGDTVEDFSLPSTNGTNISMSQYDGAKGYILVFTSNVCPFAVANEGRLTTIHNDLVQQGYPVIAINSNEGDTENLESMQSRVTTENLPFAYLKDSAKVYERFGAVKTPHVFLVDENMVLRYQGSIDDNVRSAEDVEEKYLVNAVNSLMNNEAPNPAVTKSIGCPIKRGGEKTTRKRKGKPHSQALMERVETIKQSSVHTKQHWSDKYAALDIDQSGLLIVTEI